jgi:hypothetical protein
MAAIAACASAAAAYLEGLGESREQCSARRRTLDERLSMLARIFRPSKSAMQSGKAKTQEWVLEFEPAAAKVSDPLMGWTQTRDSNGQVRLVFETQDEAVAYATRHGIAFEVLTRKDPPKIIKAYADNFAFNRRQPWTH